MKFLKKIFPYIFLIISTFLLVYTFYKSEIYWDGTKSQYYLKYYFFSLTLVLFSIIIFFLKDNIKEYLVIIFSSIIVTLYTFETYLTFNNEIKKSYLYKKKTGKKFDKRTKLQIYEDLKKKNDKIKLTVYPSSYLNLNSLFPFSGVSNSKTIYCNENGYYSIYKSDRYGFNNPDDEWSNEKVEYLLVGDSYTHGACVNRPDDIASVLRLLSEKSVLNLGYGDTGPLIHYAILREYLKKNVKKILWIYYEGNDLQNLKKELKNNVLSKYYENENFSQNLKKKQNEIDKVANDMISQTLKIDKSRNSKFLNLLKLYKIRTSIFDENKKSIPPKSEFKKIISSVKKLSKENNSKLFFIYLPDYYRYTKDFDNSNYELVRDIIKDLDIEFIDIHQEIFDKEQNPKQLFPFEQFGHYNKAGYKKIAEKLFQITKD